MKPKPKQLAGHVSYRSTTMRLLLLLGMTASLLLITFLTSSSYPASASAYEYASPTPGYVVGSVTNQDGVPLPGMEVKSYRMQCIASYALCLDSGGHIWVPSEDVFTDANGNYAVHGSSYYQFYFSDPSGQRLPQVYEINVPLEGLVLNVVLPLPSTAGGKVTDLFGNPIPNVAVSFSSASEFVSANTDQYGNYLVSGLPYGDYKIQFWPGQGSPFVSEYYDDKADYGSASVVSIHEDSHLTGLDATLKRNDCSGQTPQVQLKVAGVYWNSYQDYSNRLLTVEYEMNNSGQDTVGLRIVGAVSTNGVTVSSTLPMDVGTIGPGSSRRPSLVYHVPESVVYFSTSLQAVGLDGCGNQFSYPAPAAAA